MRDLLSYIAEHKFFDMTIIVESLEFRVQSSEFRVQGSDKVYRKEEEKCASSHDDRQVRNKIEGVNKGQGEAAETIHHLFIAKLRGKYYCRNLNGVGLLNSEL